ncbi:RNA-guided endonuclease InsQ/TnpB family protein [Salininema proteolyticum]|uniref:RNA-guided endonuclease InsQ/TnpB family protein n=1 Tax=Salininema proteolyticum TaxID=1607685 RepID=A0ABV8TT01_9ACTN
MDIVADVKQVVTVKLVPDTAQFEALSGTLSLCNEQANRISRIAFRHRNITTGRVERKFALQKRVYQSLKDAGLSAQPAIRTIGKIVDSYTTVYGQVKAGILRGKRKRSALSKPVEFRPAAAQPFDDRCLSWDLEARTVSIWTTAGRLKGVSFACSITDLKTLAQYRKGESDLFERDGVLYLAATVDVPEPAQYEPIDFIGVDRGIVNLATTSDEVNYQGKGLDRYRRRQARVRSELQAKQTKAAKRKLKQRARRESRHASHVNHKISKEIVSEAERTGRGVALEELEGIRDRVRLPRSQRGRISHWPFYQLAQYIAYKAVRAGVPVVVVDAHYTSQMCPLCHHTERANRKTRDDFECRGCGLAGPADVIAAVNVRARARVAWAVSQGSGTAA